MSLNSINILAFVNEKQYVYCEVETESICATELLFNFQSVRLVNSEILIFLFREDNFKETIRVSILDSTARILALAEAGGTALPPEVPLPHLENPSLHRILLLVQTTADLATLVTGRVKTARIHVS